MESAVLSYKIPILALPTRLTLSIMLALSIILLPLLISSIVLALVVDIDLLAIRPFVVISIKVSSITIWLKS